MSDIGVFVECKNGGIRKAALEILSKAKDLNKGSVHALVLGHNLHAIAEELTSYADTVIVVDHEDLKEYRWDTYSDILSKIAPSYSMVFAASTTTGKDLFPRLAARLDVSLIADAVGIETEGEVIKVKKPLFGGRIISWIKWTGALVTFRPNSFGITKNATPGTIKKEALIPTKDARLTVMETHKDPARVDLQEADFIICGGRGMKGPEHFAILEEIASSMNGRVGASRAVVDNKWRDYDDQIGKSGRTVSPKIYIGCGVSGALHHTMGMDTSKAIVAINKDPTAPIFDAADYGIVDDLFTILPILKEELEKAKE